MIIDPDSDNTAPTRATFWARVEDFQRRSWLPILSVASLSLLVACIALSLSFCTYRRVVEADRPILASATGKLYLNHLTVDWYNIGKKPARRGTATLLSVNPVEKLAKVEIEGAGTNILPGYGGRGEFDADPQKLSRGLVVCIVYYDDDGKPYNQSFLFELGPLKQNIQQLLEQKPPSEQACP